MIAKPTIFRARNVYVSLFGAVLVLSIAMTRGHFYLSDEMQVYQQTRSLWENGDLSVPPTINTLAGRGGRYFAPYGAGQSVLALPFYGLGKVIRRALERQRAQSWMDTFAGPPIGDAGRRWGGEVEIFFVNLFNSIVIAGLAVIFCAFSVRLGASHRYALIAAALLIGTTHVAGFGVGFLQHPLEAVLLLGTFYLLFVDSSSPRWQIRFLAGIAAGMAVLVRISTLALLPAISAYMLWYLYRRNRGSLRKSFIECAPFAIAVAIGIVLTLLVNLWKWGAPSLAGSYSRMLSLDHSLLAALYGYLFSPGQSIFLFSPLLVLAPIYFRSFGRRYFPETALILGMLISYMIFYGRSSSWNGQWCFGPRFLMPLVPFLLLPLGLWLQNMRSRTWLAIAPLLMLGFFVEVLHVAVNVSFVYYRAGYVNLVPPYSHIFIPEISQIVTHWQALLACDDRVDMWLVNVGRGFGPWRVWEAAMPLLAVFMFCIERLILYVCTVETMGTRAESAESAKTF